MSQNEYGLISFAGEDPFIAKNMSDFTKFFSRSPSRSDRTTNDSVVDLATGDNSDLRGQKKRTLRGIKSTKNVTNFPSQIYKEDRIHNLDHIPYEVYKKMEKDPSAFLAMQLLIGVISSLKYSIKTEREDVKKVIEYAYRRHHNHLINNLVSTSFPYGFAFAEKVLLEENVKLHSIVDGEKTVVYNGRIISIKKIQFINPEANIEFYRRKKTDEIAKITQYQAGEKVAVKRKRLVWFALDKKFSSIFGRPRFKNFYPQWYYNNISYQYSVHHVERNGSPNIEARFPSGEVQDPETGAWVKAADVMADMLESMVSNGVILLPSDRDKNGEYEWQISYVEPKNTDISTYSQFSQHNQRLIFQALGIPDAVLMSDGNFSETDAKLDIMMITMEGLIDQIQDCIQSDVIDYLVSMNFGPDVISEVEFNIDRGGLRRTPMIKELMRDTIRQMNSMSGYVPDVLLDIRALAAEAGIAVTSRDEVMSVDENANRNGETMQDEAQRDEDSNNRDRVSKDTRDRGRAVKRGKGGM